jgi:hypothetical protein
MRKFAMLCQGQGKRATTSLPILLCGLDTILSFGSNPHRASGDAVWTRQTAGRACMVDEEEVVRAIGATFKPLCQTITFYIVEIRNGKLLVSVVIIRDAMS